VTDHTTTDSFDGLDQDHQSRLTPTASPDVVFEALTTIEGLAGWWTSVAGDGLTGGELTFSFGDAAPVVMRVDAAERGVGVRWTNVAGHLDEWVGTTVHFDIKATPPGGSELRFRHAGLTPRLECYSDCKGGWDHFIPSLRAYVESGTGNPWMSEADLARHEARAERRQSANVS